MKCGNFGRIDILSECTKEVLSNTVGGEAYFVASCQILNRVSATLALAATHGDDKWDLHLVCLADLISDLAAGEIDRDCDVFTA